MAASNNFGVWDFVSLFVLLAATCAPGFYNIFKTKKNNTARDFLVSTQGLGTVSLMLSMVVSLLSSMAFTTMPADVYRNGIIFFNIGISAFTGLTTSALLYVPVFVNLKVGSIFEYFEVRFNIYVRFVFSGMFIIQDIFQTAMIIYTASLTFNQVCSFDVWIAIAIMTSVTITYTAFGGFKTVVWTDVAQSVVMVISIFTILIKGCWDQGGVTEIWKNNREGNRTKYFIFEQSKDSAYTFWTLLFGTPIIWLTYGCHQSHIQRCMACGSLKTAIKSTIATALIVFGLSIFLSSFGFLIYSKYKDCDPLKSGEITAYDQIMPLFAAQTLQFIPGLTGLYLAGIISAALSSISSCINSSTCLIVEDFVKKFFNFSGETRLVAISKTITVAYGLFCVGAVFLVQQMDGIVQATFVIKGITLGPQIGYFTIGMLSPWTGTMAASVGFLVSVAFVGWVSIGTLITKPFVPAAPISVSGCNTSDAIAFLNSTFYNNHNDTAMQDTIKDAPFYLYTFNPAWYGCWAMTTVLVVGLCVTLIAPQDPELVDPKYIFPFVTKLLKRLPEKTKQRLGFEPAKSNFFLKKKHNVKEQEMQKIGLKQGDDSPVIITKGSHIVLSSSKV